MSIRHLKIQLLNKSSWFSYLPLDVTLCEEAFFRFAVPTKLTPNWLSVLVDNLPGTKLNAESVERIKRRHSSQEQTFQLLKLWKHQNKDQDMVKKIIQGVVTWNKQVNQKSKHLFIIKQKQGYVPVCCMDDVSLWELLLDWKSFYQVMVEMLFLKQSHVVLFSPPPLPNLFCSVSKRRSNTFQMQA